MSSQQGNEVTEDPRIVYVKEPQFSSLQIKEEKEMLNGREVKCKLALGCKFVLLEDQNRLPDNA